MPNYTAIKSEIDTDPLTRYAGLDAVSIAANMNIPNRSVDRDTIETWEVYEAINRTEYTALSVANKALISDILSLGRVNAKNGSQAASVLVSVFGGGSTTITSLVAVRADTVSRATELGFGRITPGVVESAIAGVKG